MEEIDYDIQLGILIHQLPKELVKLIEVPPRDVKHTCFDELGMRVYFSRQEKCEEFIRKKSTVLNGISFNIYSTVTCLTVFHISSSASRETIETYLTAKGMRVHDLYQIRNTNNYRIILDVPEVLANILLDSIKLDSHPEKIFPVDFYCRVCREEGHKQYQCQKSLAENPGADQNGSEGKRSNKPRNFYQGNAARPSLSGAHNTTGRTIGRTTGVRSVSNLPARENADLPKASPSTSSTPTNKVVPGKARRRLITSVKATKRSSKMEYPCKEIVKIIMKVRGILSPEVLCDFLETVHHKKDVIKYAIKFTPRIEELIEQIRSIISQYNQQNSGSSIANKDITILDNLCNRLALQMLK